LHIHCFESATLSILALSIRQPTPRPQVAARDKSVGSGPYRICARNFRSAVPLSTAMSAQPASFETTDGGFSAPKSYVAFGTFAGFDPVVVSQTTCLAWKSAAHDNGLIFVRRRPEPACGPAEGATVKIHADAASGPPGAPWQRQLPPQPRTGPAPSPPPCAGPCCIARARD